MVTTQEAAAEIAANPPFRIACAWCGSTKVSRDAWAEWDVGRQRWVLGPVFDAGFCHVCECDSNLKEVGFGTMNWTEAVEAAVRRQASRHPDGCFTRADLIENELEQIVADCGSTGTTPRQTLSRELQELRSAGWIEFLDELGSYRWIGQ